MRSLRRPGWLAASLLTFAGQGAAAHTLQAGANDWLGWTFDGWVTVPLSLTAMLFMLGSFRLAARSHHPEAGRRYQAMIFGAGWVVLGAALISPLHAAGQRSFAAHMLEHELLMLLAAPLLVAAQPMAAMLWAFPLGIRRVLGRAVMHPVWRGLWRRATGPFWTTGIQAASLWIWHTPVLFDKALASDAWHIAQHVSFLVTALLFWTAMLRLPGRHAGGATRAVAAFCLFATSLVSGALGALMAFSPSPWYAGYARLATSPFSLTPAEDQQLAGLLMWIPGGLVHAGAALWLVTRILHNPTDERRRRFPDAP